MKTQLGNYKKDLELKKNNIYLIAEVCIILKS